MSVASFNNILLHIPNNLLVQPQFVLVLEEIPAGTNGDLLTQGDPLGLLW
jgi:hypothetical protein